MSRAAKVRTAATCLAVLSLGGCGGPLSITGGSVPIGSARVLGRVVRADNVNSPVAGALVVLAQGAYRSERSTSPDGAFDFGGVKPGPFACSVKPPDGTGLSATWAWRFELGEAKSAKLVAAVPPKAHEGFVAGNVTVNPPGASIAVGETLRFSAIGYDAAGLPAPFRPAILLEGDVGTLDSDGFFHAVKPGTGLIRAIIGSASAAATIRVTPEGYGSK